MRRKGLVTWLRQPSASPKCRQQHHRWGQTGQKSLRRGDNLVPRCGCAKTRRQARAPQTMHSQRVRSLATETLGVGNLVATTLCQSRVPSAAPSKEQTPSHGWRAEIHLASAKCRRVTRARTHNSLNSRGLSGTYKRLSTAANSSASEPIIPQIEEPAGLWVQFPLAGIWRKKKRRRRLNA